ncbi:hypothetical protein KKD80_00975 [Patescibacteria group bacterium]|nr:hypothetical protein [Patescibacteria group bacterium]
MAFKLNSIRTVYFYLIALIALMMIVWGTVDLANLGLTTWVFKNADRADDWSPPAPYYMTAEVKMGETAERCAEKCDLTESEQLQIQNWLVDYKNWQDQQGDLKIARKQKNAVRDISMLVVAIPLFLWHWKMISRETREAKENINKEV